MPKKKVWRVEWENTETGETGHGKWSERKHIVQAWVDHENKEWPFIIHKIGEAAV
jgi:hypothetical protein